MNKERDRRVQELHAQKKTRKEVMSLLSLDTNLMASISNRLGLRWGRKEGEQTTFTKKAGAPQVVKVREARAIAHGAPPPPANAPRAEPKKRVRLPLSLAGRKSCSDKTSRSIDNICQNCHEKEPVYRSAYCKGCYRRMYEPRFWCLEAAEEWNKEVEAAAKVA
jgi:hypothetical protein